MSYVILLAGLAVAFAVAVWMAFLPPLPEEKSEEEAPK